MLNNLANYAVKNEKSGLRLYKENNISGNFLTNFEIDRNRIINSSAFRRLQYKTQVFVNYHGDHFRTRLTHSLEVAQIAKIIAKNLALNQDLAEITSLTHDLGHPPFGHSGEDALDFAMKNFLQKEVAHFGFSHNANSLKIITKTENDYIDFSGLNLCWHSIEATAKHNGPIDVFDKKTNQYILDFNEIFDLNLSNSSCLEAQIAAISDDIAYNNHDLEDALRANLFEIEQVLELEIIGEIYYEILQKNPRINREKLVASAKRKFVEIMILDVIENTKKNIKENKIENENDVRNCKKNLVCFSPNFEIIHQKIKKFLLKNMYNHTEILDMKNRAMNIIKNLFEFYSKNPELLPEKYYLQIQEISSKQDFAILIADYIAGMTDRFAIKTHNKFLANFYK